MSIDNEHLLLDSPRSSYATAAQSCAPLLRYLSGTDSSEGQRLYANFTLFCLLFSVSHATVDAVLAYATAELGSEIGSDAGFALYIVYTFSALLLAKPAVRTIGPKYGVAFGLCCLLLYVGAFLLALMMPAQAFGVFVSGAAIGGVGAGVLWTSQGEYFSVNAIKFAKASNVSKSIAITNFASVFAVLYLSLETAFKLSVTIIFLLLGRSSSWRLVVFGGYTAFSFAAAATFVAFIEDLNEEDIDYGFKILRRDFSSQDIRGVLADVSAVYRALLSVRRLQLMVPYQVCFGLSAGFMGYYVNSFIVARFVGDGYIGVLSSLSTFSAVLLAMPYAALSNSFRCGKYIVMMTGGLCFLLTSSILLVLRDEQLSGFATIVLYYLIYGAARGAWESTNKAVISEYFPRNEDRDVAFASVYFTSGLAGACGYYFYKYMERTELVLLNSCVALVALVCYHKSSQEQLAAMPLASDETFAFSDDDDAIDLQNANNNQI